ncbi:MAG: PorV/PorQ family protein [Chitinophagales bacterium]|jgi:outer membrane protein OmpA-like peptidoglycan-associated protein|nr:PorV/PorQ family protein [Chitinophagales bacterium]
MFKKLFFGVFLSISLSLFAGNSDRAGQAGAYELLMNPQARTMGMFGINSASVRSVDAFGSNIAGLAFTKNIAVNANYTSWLTGSNTGIINIGVGGEVSKNNVLGFHINYLDLGNIDITTTAGGTQVLGQVTPFFMNLGLSYARRFSQYVSAGMTMKMITEGISNIGATGVALDAGLQYTTGEKNDIHFGVFLRNLGFPMVYSGDGLTYKRPPSSGSGYELPFNQRPAKFELPTQFSIAVTKDFYFGTTPEKGSGFCNPQHRLSVSANFLYNAFGKDNFGLGAEYGFQERFMIRLGYLYEDQPIGDASTRAHLGLAAGVSADISPSKDIKNGRKVLEISYNYRPSRVFMGSHNVGLAFHFNKYNPCDVFESAKKVAEEIKDADDKAKDKAKDKPSDKPKEIIIRDTVIIDKTPQTETQVKEINTVLKGFSNKINFKLASNELNERSKGVLDVVGDIMNNYPNERFGIEGHTDEMGTAENNMKLSMRRAYAVADYLIDVKKVNPKSIVVDYFGEERPIADNNSEEGRKLNRRTEIFIISKSSNSSSNKTEVKTVNNPIRTKPNLQPTKQVDKPSSDLTPKESDNIPKVPTAKISETKEENENPLADFASTIKFKAGNDSLLIFSVRNIKKLSDYLKSFPGKVLMISAHTDNSKYAIDNMTLSRMRAEAVKKELMANGIDEKFLKIEFFGDTQPRDASNTEDAQILNRRVELRFLN